jgi:hypothetical protein
MDNSKVVITAYYISVMGQMIEERMEKDDIASAKDYVERNMSALTKPKYDMSSTEKEEEGKQYDVTRLTIFNFSHLDIVDYTDVHEIEEETEIINNEK